MVVDEAVGCLCPFQDDIGSFLSMECKKTAVEPLAFLFEHTHRYLDAGVADFLDTAPLYLGKGIDGANHHTPDTFLDNQIGAGRCLAIVGAGFQTHVDGRLRQQGLILWSYRGKGIYLSMSLAATYMIALADDSAVGTHNHRTHHRIRLRVLLPVLCQLYTTAHVFLVFYHHFFTFLLFYLFTFHYLCKHDDI